MSATLYFKVEGDETSFCRLNSGDYLNMANSNCRVFLSAIGYSACFEDLISIPIHEFEAALQRFLNSEIASYVDTGTRTTVDAGHVTMVHCGRREGYLTEKVELALRLTKIAMEKGATHVYFT